MPAIQPIDASAKMKKPAPHPSYSEMILDSIGSLKDRGGSSRQAILKHIMENYRVGSDQRVVNQHLKVALRAGVSGGRFKQQTGTGAVGRFRLGDTAKKVFKKTARAKAKKAERLLKTKAARRLSFSAAALAGMR